MKNTTTRVALVTGANRGIGYAVAEKLARKGLTVVIGARDRQRGEEARKSLAAKGLDVHLSRIDVDDSRSISTAIDGIADTFSRLDVLINNAGIMAEEDSNLVDLPLSLLRATLATNFFGPLLLCQACIPLMRKQRYGRIVNISSTLGSLADITNPLSSLADLDTPAYRLSKTMLNGITALLAKELDGDNILINSVCPGWVRTDLGGPEAPTLPEEAARTPVWLATLGDDGPTGGFFSGRQPIAW